MDQSKILDISWGTILKIAVAFICLYIIFLIRDILIWLIFALIISVLFEPAIEFLRKFMPRVLAVILIYLVVFGVLGFSIYSTAPLFISEIRQFSQVFPEYFSRIAPPLEALGIEAFESFEKFSDAMEQGLIKVSSNIFSALGAVFGGIFATFTIFSIALFVSLEEKGLENVVRILSPKKYENFVLSLLSRTEKKVSGWFGAKILCCIFVGLLTFITCYALGIKYAITFGFFAGVLNMIPIIGSVVSGLMIVLLIALTSWPKALFFLIAFIIIQQIENNILSPVLTRKFIGLSPALVLVAVIVGGKFWGVMGALLAIPLAGILFEFARDFLKKRKEEKAATL